MNASGWTRSKLRWAVPAGVAAAIGLTVAWPGSSSADVHPSLPTMTPAALVAAVDANGAPNLSGVVTETARVGIPELPGTAGGTAASTLSLLTGKHELRVWLAGDARQRVALIGQSSEQDVVRNGPDVWRYDSTTDTVTHSTLPAAAKESATPATPVSLASDLLATLSKSSTVTMGPTARVAGLNAYQLDVVPKTTQTLVGRVRIAVAAATRTPLRVQLFSRSDLTTPALELGFSSVSYTVPGASVFAQPHAGTVTNAPLSSLSSLATGDNHPDATAAAPPAGTDTSPSVIGEDWTAAVSFPAASSVAQSLNGGDQLRNRQLDAVTTSGPAGRSLQTSLFSLLLTKDGRVLIGAVPSSVLATLAAG